MVRWRKKKCACVFFCIGVNCDTSEKRNLTAFSLHPHWMRIEFLFFFFISLTWHSNCFQFALYVYFSLCSSLWWIKPWSHFFFGHSHHQSKYKTDKIFSRQICNLCFDYYQHITKCMFLTVRTVCVRKNFQMPIVVYDNQK